MENIPFHIGKSNIQGKGVIAKRFIRQGETIGLAIRMNMDGSLEITQNLGRWVNHSEKLSANSKLFKRRDGWYLVAIRDIPRLAEITSDYKTAPDFIKRPEDYQMEFN